MAGKGVDVHLRAPQLLRQVGQVPGALPVAKASQLRAVQEDAPTMREHARKAAQERGLAAAVLSHEGAHRPRPEKSRRRAQTRGPSHQSRGLTPTTRRHGVRAVIAPAPCQERHEERRAEKRKNQANRQLIGKRNGPRHEVARNQERGSP